MSFADRLRAIRLDRGFKQKDVAAAIGISEPNYSMYEHGTREPGITKLTKLASVLNVSADYLLGITPNGPQSPQTPDFWTSLSEEERDLINIVFGNAFPVPRTLLLQIIMLYSYQPITVRVQLVEHLLDVDEHQDRNQPSLLPRPNVDQIHRALELYYGYQESLKDPITKKD